ncbi:MAG: SpoIID/LytB domain-containing protein [Lachnospiraceae bacterium]|nr:SpoIID/LytB domain-containing protein [Lachnospiraceae bacterium]
MRREEIIHNVIKLKHNKAGNRRGVSGPDSRDLGAILLFIFLLPYIVSFFFGHTGSGGTAKEGEAVEGYQMEQGLFQEVWEEAEFIICSRTGAGMEVMPMETYLLNRLPATIDTGYEIEALKAQAVILRTELIRKYQDARKAGEELEQIGGKPCIYIEDRLIAVDGNRYDKCREAVEETEGMYLIRDRYPVKAPYFAVSAGTTRNGSEALPEEEYAYLKAVVCNRDFTSPEYTQSIQLGKKAFIEGLQELIVKYTEQSGVKLEMDNLVSQLNLTRDSSGYVTEVGIGEISISGESFRAAFSLPSSCFELEEGKDFLWINTKGVGHGLGMSQYGANEMAKKGSDFIDILGYYFLDAVIERLK